MQQIVIIISEIYLDQLNVVAEELHREGMIITRVYQFGIIFGEAEEEVISRIRDHKGVASLVEEKKPSIPPPDADIQ